MISFWEATASAAPCLPDSLVQRQMCLTVPFSQDKLKLGWGVVACSRQFTRCWAIYETTTTNIVVVFL